MSGIPKSKRAESNLSDVRAFYSSVREETEMEGKTVGNSFEVTLADGTSIGGLKLNGNNFISATRISESMFEGKLAHVTISGNPEFDDFGLIGEHENMELIQCKQYGDEYWFILRDIPADELRQLQTEARLDYIEMMEDL